ncbi:hypothetical protein [Rathayibacter sp. VKM Ac-2927]|uniref:hypothetical protein n=1 Tax=Rathayibacter sp. VKM Ac-2927 TaxID=2929478 RepID=UPI001FB3F1AE|nr:hypothetical protein [Rathayibacter sp. VKM Ac-2927]MCJ1688476.1 hypothetical protein [Rathayibacter sp. VKM Ac-2927]
MNDEHSTSDTPAEHTTQASAPVEVTATSETSWMILAGNGNMLLGHATHDGDTYTAYDAQELRIGQYPTREDAVNAVTTGTL